ncbi:MAG TPA: hypothetical protein VKF39_03340, partial [Nitrososphaerales archaeon]|nr:hypothetical protein [Nitrososphaerales archaeon]
PIVRTGTLATPPCEVLQDEVRIPDGGRRTRRLRGFLVDGGVIPGSSGSPVILRPTIGRLVKGKIQLGVPPALLLGIVAETKYAPIQVSGDDSMSFADLGLAFDASTIKETIESFFE